MFYYEKTDYYDFPQNWEQKLSDIIEKHTSWKEDELLEWGQQTKLKALNFYIKKFKKINCSNFNDYFHVIYYSQYMCLELIMQKVMKIVFKKDYFYAFCGSLESLLERIFDFIDSESIIGFKSKKLENCAKIIISDFFYNIFASDLFFKDEKENEDKKKFSLIPEKWEIFIKKYIKFYAPKKQISNVEELVCSAIKQALDLFVLKIKEE
mgnify:FL=1